MKEVLLAGGYIEFPYKAKENEWVGMAKLSGHALGCGIKPKIVAEIPNAKFVKGGRKEYEWNQIEQAVSEFISFVLNPDNLCYKQTEAMLELYNEGYLNIDLDNSEDRKLVRDRQKLLHKK
jgi:hypothetical protein